MLFRKKIERSCAYCLYGTALEEDQVLCVKKGLLPQEKPCFRFRYDPCRRMPKRAKAMDFSRYDGEDYTL